MLYMLGYSIGEILMLKELKYLTIQEQIDNLKSKGLIIENDKKAENYLCENWLLQTYKWI